MSRKMINVIHLMMMVHQKMQFINKLLTLMNSDNPRPEWLGFHPLTYPLMIFGQSKTIMTRYRILFMMSSMQLTSNGVGNKKESMQELLNKIIVENQTMKAVQETTDVSFRLFRLSILHSLITRIYRCLSLNFKVSKKFKSLGGEKS